MNIVGFVDIKKDATTCKGAQNPNEFIGETCAVMEFGHDESVLVLNPKGTAMAMFDKEDIRRQFKCTVEGGAICPPNQNTIENMLYAGKCMSRKGGYNSLLKMMVIQASLMKGVFDDRILWAKQ